MQSEVYVYGPTYGGGGGGLEFVGAFLLEGLSEVGSAVGKVEIDLLVRSEPRAPRKRAVDDTPDEEFDALLALITGGEGVGPNDPEWVDHHEMQRAKGPALTFRRSARKVSVRIISDLSELDAYGTDEVTPEVFATAAREVVAALDDLPRRIKPTDDCDARALLSHVRSRLNALPTNDDQLRATFERIREDAERRREAMDDWQALDIDWTVFAPGTRERFNDPFFFDPGDEDAPHGNDAGSDFLAAYLAERPRDGLAFLQSQVSDMGYGSLSNFAAADIDEHDDMVIAAAFAEVMVRGSASAELKQLALQALDRRQTEAPSPRNEQMRRALN